MQVEKERLIWRMRPHRRGEGYPRVWTHTLARQWRRMRATRCELIDCAAGRPSHAVMTLPLDAASIVVRRPSYNRGHSRSPVQGSRR
jgi:hypothetical protein